MSPLLVGALLFCAMLVLMAVRVPIAPLLQLANSESFHAFASSLPWSVLPQRATIAGSRDWQRSVMSSLALSPGGRTS